MGKFARMMLVPICFFIFSGIMRAGEQEATAKNPLQKKLTARFHVSQISFTNWAKGGDNSINYTSQMTAGLKRDTERYSWFIHSELAFGQSKQGDQGIRNTLDRIDVDANFTLKKKKFMNPFVMFTLDTQFAEGYDYKKDPPTIKSDFWDPAYLVQSFGTGVQISQEFQTRLGLAVKETFTRRFRNFSDDPSTRDRKEWLKIEPGMSSRTDLNYKINNHLQVISSIQIFSNLRSAEEIDVIWDSKLQAKMAKYVSIDVNLYALYDRNISDKTQLKQFLGIGFVYDFF